MGGIWNFHRAIVILHLSIIVSSVYVYKDTPVNYRNARLACEAGNGQLVVLDSQEKIVNFTAFMAGIKVTYPTLEQIWFGLSYDTSWKKFIWPDESYVTWTNWTATQPYRYQMSPDPQLCGRIRRPEDFRLTTTYCNNPYKFVCESASSVYTYVDFSMKYHDAIINCRNRGETLVMMDSMTKVNDFIAYVDLNPAISSTLEMWTSLTYDLSWDSFLWLDDVQTQISTFDYWTAIEPDNIPPLDKDRPFICGRASDADNYEWTMVDCRQLVPFACEYAAPPQFVGFAGRFKKYAVNKKPFTPAFDSLSTSSVKACTLVCVGYSTCAFIHFQSNVCSLHAGSSVEPVEDSPSAEIWERF